MPDLPNRWAYMPVMRQQRLGEQGGQALRIGVAKALEADLHGLVAGGGLLVLMVDAFVKTLKKDHLSYLALFVLLRDGTPDPADAGRAPVNRDGNPSHRP